MAFSDYKRVNITNNIPSAIEVTEPGPRVYSAIWLLTLAFFLKLALAVFTFGMKVPAGLFIPSLLLGAIMGRIVGIGNIEINNLNAKNSVLSWNFLRC